MIKPGHFYRLATGAVVQILRKSHVVPVKWNTSYVFPPDRTGETCAFAEKFLLYYCRLLPDFDVNAYADSGEPAGQPQTGEGRGKEG